MSSERKNEGPGGCVPWERYEALRALCESAIDNAESMYASENVASLRAALAAITEANDV